MRKLRNKNLPPNTGGDAATACKQKNKTQIHASFKGHNSTNYKPKIN